MQKGHWSEKVVGYLTRREKRFPNGHQKLLNVCSAQTGPCQQEGMQHHIMMLHVDICVRSPISRVVVSYKVIGIKGIIPDYAYNTVKYTYVLYEVSFAYRRHCCIAFPLEITS